MKKRFAATGILFLVLLSFFAGIGMQNVYAEETKNFSGEVTMLKEEEGNYVLQVDVENAGEDFDGIVRLAFNNAGNDKSCVFDTAIVLPAQGQKQYTITIPEVTIQGTRGNGSLYFLDKKGEILQSVNFKNILTGKVQGIRVGVLSESFDKLSYWDMNGEDYCIGDKEKPISLIDLDPKKIESELDGLYFLIIDRFDTSTLEKDVVKAIEEWVDNGGWLIMGTGEAGDEAFKGFDEGFIGIEVGDVSKKGEENSISAYMQQNNDNYYILRDSGIDAEQLAVAELRMSQYNGYQSSNYPGYQISCGQGSIGVLSISLCEDEMMKAKPDLCRCIYDEIMYSSGSAGNYNSVGGSDYLFPYAFGVIDNKNTDVDFTWLKVIIVIYVVVAGPILYLVLRKMKKRESYWAGVPILGLVFVGAVFLIGQTQNVNGTRLYSVTSERLDGREGGMLHTYYSGYHSGVKEWDVVLNDNYECAGSAFEDYGTTAISLKPEEYHYRIKYENGIHAGMKPQKSFETGYLYAQGKGTDKGSIRTEKLVLSQAEQEGTVTNETGYDIPYAAFVSNSYMMIVQDWKAGETIDIKKQKNSKKIIYKQPVDYLDDTFYSLTGSYGAGNMITEETDDMAALFVGIMDAKKECADVADDIVIATVMPGTEKTVKGKCTEIAYSCFYTIVKQEVTNAAN